jgi:hypothetical protein
MKFIHRVSATALYLAAAVCMILFGIFMNWHSFTTPYDPVYIRDHYDHSQWKIPKSIRPIDDATLYQVAGYDLAAKNEFYQVNPEVPPLGKYFYGWSILLFGNPYVITIPLFIATAIMVFGIGRIVFDRPVYAAAATFVFTSEPLILGQLGVTLLDLPQLLFLLLHLYAMLLLTKAQPRWRFWSALMVAGIALGGFLSVKIGFFAAALIAADLFILWRLRQLPVILLVGAIAVVTYLATYVGYLTAGNSLRDLLASQKWMLSFYLDSPADPIKGMIVPLLLFGSHKGWWPEAVWERAENWTIFWPVLAAAPFVLLRNKKWFAVVSRPAYQYLGVFLIAMTACLAVVPLFARYLILLLPILIIPFTVILLQLRPWVRGAIICLIVLHTALFLQPPVWKAADSVENNWELSTYKELYSYLDLPFRETVSRDAFWRFMLDIESDLRMEKKVVDVTIPYTWPWQRMVSGTVEVVYYTELGEFRQLKEIIFVKENGAWRVRWSYDLALEGLRPDSTIVVEETPGRYGTVQSGTGTIVSSGGTRPFFRVLPKEIQNDRDVQEQVSQLTGIAAHDIEFAYLANHPADWPVDIGFLDATLSATILDSLQLQPGVQVEQRSTRVLNIPEGSTTDAILLLKGRIQDLRSKIDPVPAGKLILRQPDGSQRILVEQTQQDGEDAVID